MRTLIILKLFLLILNFNFCTAQSATEKKLIGKWILIEETDSFGDIEPLKESNSESDSKSGEDLKTTLTFNNDKSISINQMGNEYKENYRLTDSVLTLGNRDYILVSIDEKKLIYKDKDGIFNNHYEYRKIE